VLRVVSVGECLDGFAHFFAVLLDGAFALRGVARLEFFEE